MDELKGDDKEELIELLDCHFDPEKQAVFPLVKKHRSKRGGKYIFSFYTFSYIFSTILCTCLHTGHKENVKPKQNTPASPDSTNKTTKRSGRNRRRLANKKESYNANGGGQSNKDQLANNNNNNAKVNTKENIFAGHAVVTNNPPIAAH